MNCVEYKTLYQVEREHVLTVLEATNNNKTHTAEALGITLRTLYARLHEYGLFEKYSKQAKRCRRASIYRNQIDAAMNEGVN